MQFLDNKLPYRKSHTRFRLVPKSSTLDGRERPKGTLVQKDASFGAYCTNLNEDRDQYYQRQKCRPMTGVEPLNLVIIHSHYAASSLRYLEMCGRL